MCRMSPMMRLLSLLPLFVLFAPACKSVPEKDPENVLTVSENWDQTSMEM